MPKKSIQEQLDSQIESRRTAQVVEATEAPTFTPDIFDVDNQETALVECNFRDMSARLVETSDAPKITREVLETLGKPIKTVEMFFNDAFWSVAVRDGITTELEIKQLKLIMEYAEQETDVAARDAENRASVCESQTEGNGVAHRQGNEQHPRFSDERDLRITQMLLSKMMVDPPFSYQGQGEGTPIEDRSPVMIASLVEAFDAVQNPAEDMIYQVAVRRGVPADAFAVTGETFEWYPVGGKSKKYVDMSDEELSAEMARNRARRQVLVPAMIVDPQLTYTHIADGEVADAVEPPEDAAEAYPVELLSERFMRTLFESHRCVNVPEAGLKSLQRFLRANRDEPEGEDKGSKPVGKQQRSRKTSKRKSVSKS